MKEKQATEKPWLHGVRHVTKAWDGTVSWRGRAIEHYDFRDAEKEKEAAMQLAACCLKIESTGQEATFTSLVDFWTKIDHADGLDVPRYFAVWVADQNGPRAVVWDVPDMSQLVQIRADALKSIGGDPTGPNNGGVLIVTQEDREVVVNMMEHSLVWARRNWWTLYSGTAQSSKMLDTLNKAIPLSGLPTSAQIKERMLAPVKLDDGLLDVAVESESENPTCDVARAQCV